MNILTRVSAGAATNGIGKRSVHGALLSVRSEGSSGRDYRSDVWLTKISLSKVTLIDLLGDKHFDLLARHLYNSEKLSLLTKVKAGRTKNTTAITVGDTMYRLRDNLIHTRTTEE